MVAVVVAEIESQSSGWEHRDSCHASVAVRWSQIHWAYTPVTVSVAVGKAETGVGKVLVPACLSCCLLGDHSRGIERRRKRRKGPERRTGGQKHRTFLADEQGDLHTHTHEYESPHGYSTNVNNKDREVFKDQLVRSLLLRT